MTLQLGQPVLGVLQVRFAPGRAPDEHGLEQLASFAVRAAHALRSSERARDAGFELERSRALLSVVGEAISQLSLSHTLETAIERVAHLLGSDRVAVYLTDGDELTVAASRGIEGPHQAVADALLTAALQSRQTGAIAELDAPSDERLAPVRAHVDEAGIGSVLALGLVVGDEPIGVLAVYPRQRRTLSENERSLLTALAGQLAVVVENARLHEDVTTLNDDLNELLASEREKSKQLHAHHEISRTFAQSLSLQTTLDALAAAVVDLLGVDATVIRMPDERGIELIARSVNVNDERVDPAARMLLSRAQPLPLRSLSALLRRGEPLLLDPDLAESLGGALALLAPFLRKGSSAALIPVATPSELLATMTIISLHPDHPVAGAVTETALAIAGQAALAIDNARLYGQQKAFADTMQRSLLPRTAPEVPELELGDVYESAARARGRRRRLRLPHARRRPARRRPRRRHRPRRRRDGRHGDGEVRLPLARPRASRSRHVPRRCERGRLLGDRAGTLHHDGRGRLRRRAVGRSRAPAPDIRRRGSCCRTEASSRSRRAGSRSGSTRRRSMTP